MDHITYVCIYCTHYIHTYACMHNVPTYIICMQMHSLTEFIAIQKSFSDVRSKMNTNSSFTRRTSILCMYVCTHVCTLHTAKVYPTNTYATYLWNTIMQLAQEIIYLQITLIRSIHIWYVHNCTNFMYAK